MDLLDRYLAAIARDLPKDQAADISAELRDTLLSEIEDKEQGLGRKLTNKEVEALLVEFGHPLVVAGRYRKVQHLIGPQLFPFWWAAIRIVFSIAGAIYLAVAVIRAVALGGPPAQLLNQFLASFWPAVIFLFGAVTLAFAVLERIGTRRFGFKWRPRQLPPVNAHRRGRFSVATEVVMGGVFVLWWTGLIHFSNVLPMPTAITVSLAPVWSDFYWPILALTSSEIGINLLELFRPGWSRLNAALSLAKNIAGFVILVNILQADHWLDITASAASPFALAQMQWGFDNGMKIGLLVTAFVIACKAVGDVWRLIRARSDGQPRSCATPLGTSG